MLDCRYTTDTLMSKHLFSSLADSLKDNFSLLKNKIKAIERFLIDRELVAWIYGRITI